MPHHEFGSHMAGGDGCRHDAVEKTHLNVVLDDSTIIQFDVTEGLARFRMKQEDGDVEIFQAKCGGEIEEAKQYVAENVDAVTLAS